MARSSFLWLGLALALTGQAISDDAAGSLGSTADGACENPGSTAHGACETELATSLLQAKLLLGAQGEVGSAVAEGGSGEAGKSRPPFSSGLLTDAFEEVAAAARAKLVHGSAAGSRTPVNADVFDAVDISLPLAPPIISFSPAETYDDGKKNIVGMSVMHRQPCLVYAIGVSPAASGMDSDFEVNMGKSGCETHAFDCAVAPQDANVYNKPFAFHQWCIGQPQETSGHAADSMGTGIYADTGVANGTSMLFKTLSQTKSELKHAHINLLKFDIEGFEWKLFEDELLNATDLPEQLSFELHTEGANSYYVPPENVAGKSYREVNSLFLKLFDLGYRVASKQINRDGRTMAEIGVLELYGAAQNACAEFILVKV